jgi:hypothetical protein
MPLPDKESLKKLEYYTDLINKAFTRIRISDIRKMEQTKKPLNAMNMRDEAIFNDRLCDRLRIINKK